MSLTTVFTVCFGVVSVLALVFFLLKTKVALTLALGSAMAAVAMDHAVEALARRGLRRSWAIAAVMGVVTALLVGLGLLLVPPIVAQGKALAAELPDPPPLAAASHADPTAEQVGFTGRLPSADALSALTYCDGIESTKT